MSASVKVIGILTARPGKAGELRALLDGMVIKSRDEAGNLRYDLWQDKTDPGRFLVDELYADDVAAAAHHETPHYKHYLSQISDLAERTALALSPIAAALIPSEQ